VAPKLRIGFAGTPEFAATALTAILDAHYDVAVVLTMPDRPQGRGLKRVPSPVKSLAVEHGLPVAQPSRLGDDAASVPLVAIPLDVLVVAAFGLILPRTVLDWPRHGCVNIHASLLPRWRGAAPIQRALLSGDTETGISIMQMDAGLDTGPVIAARVVPIDPRETSGSLSERLAAEGAQAIVETLSQLESRGKLSATPQSREGSSYAAKIRSDETAVDWRESATLIDRKVRAFDPAPGATARLEGELIKIRSAEALAGCYGPPGTIARADADGIVVAAGDGAVVVREIQRAGGKRMSVAAFLAGHPLAASSRFEAVRA
jgi:methionyl-tRNA formyltransferase